jgi:hypothetical protein
MQNQRIAKDMFYGMIFFALSGASAGISVGMFFNHEKTHEQEVEFRVASICALSGAAIGFFLGAILWGLVNETGRGRSIARVMSVAVLLTSCGAPLGWLIGVGRQTTLGVPFVDRPSGMMWGLILGMLAGLILALVEYRWLHEMSESPIGPPDPPVRAENSASGLNTAKSKYPIATGNPIDFVLVALIAGGAIGGVCVASVLHETELDRGVLPMRIGLPSAIAGAEIALVIGVFVWTAAKLFPKSIGTLQFVTFVLVLIEIGAAVGWRLGVNRPAGLYEVTLDRSAGMIRGAGIGALIGVILALINARYSNWNPSKPPTADSTSLPEER